MFAELCSVARTDHPQPSVEYFLSLDQSLKNAVAVSDALCKARSSPEPATLTDDCDEASNEKTLAVMEKSRSAASWVNAALTSDLATFSIQSKQGTSGGLRNVSKRATSQQLQVMLDNGPSTVPRGRSSSPCVTSRSTTLSTPSSPKTRTALSSVSHIANEKRTAAESRSQSPVKLELHPSTLNPDLLRHLIVAVSWRFLRLCSGYVNHGADIFLPCSRYRSSRVLAVVIQSVGLGLERVPKQQARSLPKTNQRRI